MSLCLLVGLAEVSRVREVRRVKLRELVVVLGVVDRGNEDRVSRARL